MDALAALGVVVLAGGLALIGLKSYLANLRAPTDEEKKDKEPETPPTPRP